MQWFEGGIAEAVSASKQRNAVFVVFVEGKDEASKNTTDAINSPEVSAKLQGSGYVAIRIESDTTAHQQFAQIYQIVPVPSLFFIGNSGLPIEILAGATDSQTLLGRLEVVEAVHAGRQAPTAAPHAAGVASTTATSIASEVASNASSESQVNLVSKAPSVTPLSTTNGDGYPVTAAANVASTSAGIAETKAPATPSTSSTEIAPIEDRVERAKELVERKRLEKMREEEEEQRRKEIERRKLGKDMQEMKKAQQDQEMKQLQEQRRKEKEANAQARQRVLDQIAQDRANRSAQTATAQLPQTLSSELSRRSPTRVNDSTARLQFRLPDGSTHTSSFEANTLLGEVRSYVTANVDLPFRSFMLATTFPRREFSETDNSSTLHDLGLTPTAVMLVIPSGGAGVVQNARPGWGGIFGRMNNAIWALFSPVFVVLTYFRNRLFGDRQIDQGTSTTVTGGSSTSSADAKKERRSKSSATGGTIRRTGSSNIHRLHHNHSSSDDENNTWNGNSTQQM